jgi:outer membrane protein assembly factor BamB
METFTLFIVFITASICSAQIKPLIKTYLGDEQRNYYGNSAPSKLSVKWKTHHGTGHTIIGGKRKTWSGAGWTGQPLVISENGELYLIQPTLSHKLRKIRARDGKLIWSCNLGDVIKGTPSFVTTSNKNPEQKFLIISGSRRGANADFFKDPAYSLHGISYLTGKKLWQHNSLRTFSNSRDVDASGVMIGAKFCIPTENGKLLYLNPDPARAKINLHTGIPEPYIYKEYSLFEAIDTQPQSHGHELSCESSPTVYNGVAYTAAGAGRIYGHTAGIFGNKWNFNVGGDLNGTMPLTNDEHLLLGIEKEFIAGQGGVMKIKPRGKVKWYYPLPNKKWYQWAGGMVGSPAVNHRTSKGSNLSNDLACFAGIDGNLTLINHKKLTPNKSVWGPNQQKQYPAPLVLDRKKLPTGSISTPLFIGNKIIIGYDNGLDLYQVTPDQKLQLLDRLKGPMFDATPTVWNNRIYAASKNGYLYCLGN